MTLLLQETWKYQDELLDIIDRELNTDNESFNITGNIKGLACSPMDPNVQLLGRPNGGCAILYKDTIKCNIEELKCKSSRIMAVLVSWDGFKILVINVYMPTDKGTLNNEFTEVLNDICNICIESEVNHIIIGGDFNTDFSRNNPQSNALNEFCNIENFSKCLSFNTLFCLK